jgi:DNA-binding NarL/FixJ family response regulator
MPHLSKTEVQIAILIAEGHTTKEIANISNRSIKTIESHRNSIYAKLEIGNIIDVTRWVFEHKLINVEAWAVRRRKISHRT